jgi:hypothetical protein
MYCLVNSLHPSHGILMYLLPQLLDLIARGLQMPCVYLFAGHPISSLHVYRLPFLRVRLFRVTSMTTLTRNQHPH